jgi:hypothetical protein
VKYRAPPGAKRSKLHGTKRGLPLDQRVRLAEQSRSELGEQNPKPRGRGTLLNPDARLMPPRRPFLRPDDTKKTRQQ